MVYNVHERKTSEAVSKLYPQASNRSIITFDIKTIMIGSIASTSTVGPLGHMPLRYDVLSWACGPRDSVITCSF